MKYLLVILAILGITVSALALREHYREYGDSPCSINDRWDCGVVNHSPYALLGGVFEQLGIHSHIPVLGAMPVATAGILGYIVIMLVVFRRAYRWLLLLTFGSLTFSLYLAHIEKDVLGVWCVYCVASLGIISLMSLLNLGVVVSQFVRKLSPADARV
jgi:vitamin-K-epoxide reductase (warfarin-sensitive)